MPTGINAVPVRIDHACVISVTKGATEYTIGQLVPGSVKVTEPKRKLHEYDDRDDPQVPLLGVGGLGMLEAAFNASVYAADDLRDLLQSASTTNKAYQFTSVVLKVPTVKGGAAGYTVTLANAWLVDPIQLEAGAGTGGLDKWSNIKFACKPSDYVMAAY